MQLPQLGGLGTGQSHSWVLECDRLYGETEASLVLLQGEGLSTDRRETYMREAKA